jgi:hypothetical protein
MVRRRWLIAQVVLAGVLALLAFPDESSAFAGMPIALTATGPVPAIQTVSTVTYPYWINQDTVAHTVSFANGRCTVQVAPGGLADCPTGFASGPGDAYTVDGTAQASVVVQIAGRTVTLGARTHQIAGGARLTLHGHLTSFVPLPAPGPASPVTVLARSDRMHPFRRLAVVKPKIDYPKGSFVVLRWHLRVRPRARTIYIAEANTNPQTWQRAWSKPFRVRVGPRESPAFNYRALF